jgi:hypothetical protein
MGSEVRFCGTVREKAIYWMLARREESFLCVPVKILWFYSALEWARLP